METIKEIQNLITKTEDKEAAFAIRVFELAKQYAREIDVDKRLRHPKKDLSLEKAIGIEKIQNGWSVFIDFNIAPHARNVIYGTPLRPARNFLENAYNTAKSEFYG